MELTARPAEPGDLERLAELVAAGVAEQSADRGGAVWAAREARAVPADASLAELLGRDDHLVVAGCIDDVVVGYAVTHVEALRDGSTLGRIDDIFVEPEGRAVGVGETIIDVVVPWCEARGCRGIDALVLPGNRASKNFFETFGFTARALVVHRRLG